MFPRQSHVLESVPAWLVRSNAHRSYLRRVDVLADNGKLATINQQRVEISNERKAINSTDNLLGL